MHPQRIIIRVRRNLHKFWFSLHFFSLVVNYELQIGTRFSFPSPMRTGQRANFRSKFPIFYFPFSVADCWAILQPSDQPQAVGTLKKDQKYPWNSPDSVGWFWRNFCSFGGGEPSARVARCRFQLPWGWNPNYFLCIAGPEEPRLISGIVPVPVVRGVIYSPAPVYRAGTRESW